MAMLFGYQSNEVTAGCHQNLATSQVELQVTQSQCADYRWQHDSDTPRPTLIPPLKQAPSIAATTGIFNPSMRSNMACPWRAKLSASAALSQASIMPISAPATNDPGLSLIITTPCKSRCCSISCST